MNTNQSATTKYKSVSYAVAICINVVGLLIWLPFNGLSVMMSDSCSPDEGGFYCSWWGGTYFLVNFVVLALSYALAIWYAKRPMHSAVRSAVLFSLVPVINLLIVFAESKLIVR
jgi:hypothetical protein